MRPPNPKLCPRSARTAWDTARAPALAAEPWEEYECALITPMYGGGVEPGKVDRDMPVRASAIRGQLRFWWRLLHGASRSPENLFTEESALWGGISRSSGPQASRVSLRVQATPIKHDQLRPANQTYALIPGRQTPKLLNPGYKFKLLLHFAETVESPQRDQVIKALRWWASFSGVGARTRRGLGAVRVKGLTPVDCTEVQATGGRMVLRSAQPHAMGAWREAVDKLRDFRQKPGVGRNPGAGRRPGRSRWPEPDTIRDLVGPPTAHVPGHRARGNYPRAAFGLPIVFQFKRSDVAKGDPPEHVLKPAGHDRMASPLILRPYFDGERYRPLALLLPGWDDDRVTSVPVGFGSGTASPAWPVKTSTADRKRLASDTPMKGRGTDALSAFMAYFYFPS